MVSTANKKESPHKSWRKVEGQETKHTSTVHLIFRKKVKRQTHKTREDKVKVDRLKQMTK